MPADRGALAIYLHDGLGSSYTWKELPGLLGRAAGRRGIAYDRRGYGGSGPCARFAPGFMEAEVPTLVELIRHNATKPVDLVGHSDGATIALLTAADYPELVRSVVSVAAHTFVEPLTTSSISGFRDQVRGGDSPKWLGRLHGARGVALVEAWSEVWLGEEHGRWDVRGRLPEIACPVFAIQGEDDEFGSVEQLEVLGQRIARSTTWKVRRAGHTPWAGREEELVRRITAFWRAAGQAEAPG